MGAYQILPLYFEDENGVKQKVEGHLPNRIPPNNAKLYTDDSKDAAPCGCYTRIKTDK